MLQDKDTQDEPSCCSMCVGSPVGGGVTSCPGKRSLQVGDCVCDRCPHDGAEINVIWIQHGHGISCKSVNINILYKSVITESSPELEFALFREEE